MPEAGEASRSRAREDSRARLLMTTPGVDTMVSLTYASVIDDPRRFRSSRYNPIADAKISRKIVAGQPLLSRFGKR
jgi:hypothetical protein